MEDIFLDAFALRKKFPMLYFFNKVWQNRHSMRESVPTITNHDRFDPYPIKLNGLLSEH